MITDKEFTLRLIRQLTQALNKLILDKPEESLMQKEMDLIQEYQTNTIFVKSPFSDFQYFHVFLLKSYPNR